MKLLRTAKSTLRLALSAAVALEAVSGGGLLFAQTIGKSAVVPVVMPIAGVQGVWSPVPGSDLPFSLPAAGALTPPLSGFSRPIPTATIPLARVALTPASPNISALGSLHAADMTAPEKTPAILNALFDASPIRGPAVDIRHPGTTLTWIKSLLSRSRSPEFPEDGFFKLSRDARGKLLLTLRTEDFGKVFMLNTIVEKGIGENWLYSMAPPLDDTGISVSFRRAGNRIELVRKNVDYRAISGSSDELVVTEAFADSVLASVPVIVDDRRKATVIIDLEAILLCDLTDLHSTLAQSYPEDPDQKRLPYRLVKNQSHIAAAKVFPRNAEISMELRFANENPLYRLPVPDARNLALRMRYSFSAPPHDGFRPRAADERVGYFTTVYRDFTDLNASPALDVPLGRLAQRWRLEKTDLKAALSPVKRPIVWWLDYKIPKHYRAAVREGILKWNTAFEKLGFKDAIVVRDQPEPGTKPQNEAQFDAADVRYNVVHWFTGTDANFAFASWRSDPRTGEIYNAHINFSLQVLGELGYRGTHEVLAKARPAAHKRHASCSFAREVAASMSSLKDADLSPEQRARFAHKLIVSFMVHEMGHTLGLRHNFAASDFRTLDEIAHAKDGLISQTVMDYAASSFPAPENPSGAEVQTELGPYDYLAIDWGYRSVDGLSQEDATASLARVAARIGEPGYEYATDDQLDGTDPYVAHFDFGPEPVEYAARSVTRLRRALEQLAQRPLNNGEDYGALRRHFDFLNKQRLRALSLALPYIGGVRVRRVRAGQNEGKLPYEAVPAAKQRAALALILQELFSDEGVAIPKGLLAKLGPDLREPLGGFAADASIVPFEENITLARVAFLNSLLSPERLKRMAETRHLGTEVMSPQELFETLTAATGAEFLQERMTLARLNAAMNSSVLHRRLQSAYVESLIDVIKGPDLLDILDGYSGEPLEKNSYSAEAVAAASASLTTLATGLSNLIIHAEHASAAKRKGYIPDPSILPHLKHLVGLIIHALQ